MRERVENSLRPINPIYDSFPTKVSTKQGAIVGRPRKHMPDTLSSLVGCCCFPEGRSLRGLDLFLKPASRMSVVILLLSGSVEEVSQFNILLQSINHI